MIEEDDIWQIALDAGPANKHVRFFSWEHFENPERDTAQTPYITEAGPSVFQAALLKDKGEASAGKVVEGHTLLQSLWNLGLGRTSVLFNWDPKLRTFVPTLPDGVACGLSLPSAKGLMSSFILTGNTFLYLRVFCERVFASSTSIPARVALVASVTSILSAFENHLGKHANTVRSLLQLQRLFAKPREILLYIARMVDAVKHARTNEQVSSILHQRVLEVEGDDALRNLSSEILCRVSKPSMDVIAEWIGVREEENSVPITQRGSFVATESELEDENLPEYVYNSAAMPLFITPEDGSTIFETGNSLRFIKHHHPGHPLASLERHGIQPPAFEWKFAWQDIENVSAKARAYEQELRMAIRDFASGSSTHDRAKEDEALQTLPTKDSIVQTEAELQKKIEESARMFDMPPGDISNPLPDELQLLLSRLLDNNGATEPTQSFSPPLSMTSTLSFHPLLTAQANLVNATTLRLFFRCHQLRTHLSLQRQYHLFGDGVFSSRLASALFDPDRESAERQKGTMRSGVHMGLQVGSRSTWPPASSELRLALMGVLSESYYSSALYYSTLKKAANSPADAASKREPDELPGQLNFAVRQLTEAEMEKIMDPDSLFALDFLRLQYIPPSPLNLVISASALDKYDYIFRFLLRLLRMLFVVARLPRSYPDVESRYFRVEAHHFVTAISSYIFQTGIAEHWDAFEQFVSTVENRLADEDTAGELGTRVTSGLESLKSAHEHCLDSIMFSLLLRRRHKKVMVLLEEIFDHILLFAKITRDAAEGSVPQDNEGQTQPPPQPKDLYAMLKGKIRVFISVCRGLTGKRGYGKGRGTAEENTLERLGVLLEMNGYFAT